MPPVTVCATPPVAPLAGSSRCAARRLDVQSLTVIRPHPWPNLRVCPQPAPCHSCCCHFSSVFEPRPPPLPPFFFLMIRPPPKSPLFPSTPLSRSARAGPLHRARSKEHGLPRRDSCGRQLLGRAGLQGRLLPDRQARAVERHPGAARPRRPGPGRAHRRPCGRRPGALVHHGARRLCRSEEHTSELQSRLHLVCRLLLEKKNKSPE